MKNVKTFEQFRQDLNESEIVLTKNNYIGNKTSSVLTICRTTRRCLVVLRSTTHSYGLLHGTPDVDSSMVSGLRNEALRDFKATTGYDKDIELESVSILHTEGIDYHIYIALVEGPFVPAGSQDVRMYQWVTLEELLDLTPKDEDLDHLIKDNSDFFKYLKTM